ncbi:MAG: hypothetical protein ACK53C_06330 [Pseudomonadota bacterium]
MTASSSPERRLPRWLPWLAGLCAAGVIAATFWATKPSRTPAQARVESVAVAAFVPAPGADAATVAFANGLAPQVRDLLARTPGLEVPADAALAEKRVEGAVERAGERWRVRVRIVDGQGREVRSRTREWPAARESELAFALARDVTAALQLPPPKVEHVVR